MLDQLAVERYATIIIMHFNYRLSKKSDISRLRFFMDWPAEPIRLSAGEV